MICCLNPQCRKPLNMDDAKVCRNCGTSLAPLRGRYQATQPLGQGGFGRTYLALDTDRLNARCVIKQFSPQIQGTKSLEKAVQLFNQEAVRLHELGEHAQIPTLLAYFEQDSYLYLVQQFIEGQNLLQQMRHDGAFGERKIRDVLADILPVLRFVHSRQVIHRDITPANILRRQTDDRLMLIDFGVAKLIGSETGADAGTRIGTEGYSPMEQFRGGRAYPASDIYSLGATCLHLMSETKPDNLYDPLNGRWIWREYLAERNQAISEQLADILDRMLKDLVNDRYQSADEVMRDLNADSFMPASRIPPGAFSPAVKPNFPTSRPPASRPPTSQPPPSQPPYRPSIPPAPPSRPSAPPPSNPSRPYTSRPSGTPSGNSSRGSVPPDRNSSGAKGDTASQPFRDRRCLHVLTGHGSWVTGVAVNAQIIASSSLDDTVKLWNLHGEQTANLTGHTRDVNTIAITPDGKTAISGSDDCTIRLWYLPNGAPLRSLTGHTRDVSALAVSSDGQLLASGSEDRTIRLWSLSNGAPLRTMGGLAGMIRSIAITPDNRQLVSGGLDHKVRLWNLQSGEQVRVLNAHLGAVQSVVVSADRQLIASGSKDKTVRIWSLETGALVRTLTGHSREVNAIGITPDSKVLVSGSNDTTLKLWNLQTGDLLDTLTGHTDAVTSIAITSDGKRLVSGSADSTIRVWQVAY